MDKEYQIKNVNNIPSPVLVVYRDIVQKNIEHAIKTSKW